MNRKPPSIPAPKVEKRENPEIITETRKYKVITPLYGGGVEPGNADPVTVVRATEVRGHLRFWWRATRGGAFKGDLQEMKRREEEIWGSPGQKGKPGPSQITVRILDGKKGDLKKDVEITTRRGKEHIGIGEPQSPWSYAVFPLREEKDRQTGKFKPSGSVLQGVFFDLEIKYPKELSDDVEAALWAWETFGGIGARTRRGLGALECIKGSAAPAFTKQTAQSAIINGIKEHVVAGTWPKGVPHLSSSLRFKIAPQSDAVSAWEYLFKQLKSFRQLRFDGIENRPGRSKWTEPDSIRRLPRMTSADKHSKPRSTIDKFPRGKFGLPIIFKFKDDKDGDPAPTTLQGAEHDRLASPLILRPIACLDGAVGLAAILEWEPVNSKERYTPPGGLVLKSSREDYPVQSDLTAAEAGNIEPLNLGGKPQADVLQAFLDFLK